MIKKIPQKFLAFFMALLLSNGCSAKSPKITVKIMNNNPCMTSEKKTIKPDSIMVHSTATPGVMAPDWYKIWDKSLEDGGREVAVHAFVDDKCIMQYLPWKKRAWHCGGRANDTHISIEMCEPKMVKYSDSSKIDSSYDPKDPKTKKYFNAALKNMVELCAYLCEKFNIKPGTIICHKEGHDKGIASNHVDVLHWWPLHGVTMGIFRKLVSKELKKETIDYDF